MGTVIDYEEHDLYLRPGDPDPAEQRKLWCQNVALLLITFLALPLGFIVVVLLAWWWVR